MDLGAVLSMIFTGNDMLFLALSRQSKFKRRVVGEAHVNLMIGGGSKYRHSFPLKSWDMLFCNFRFTSGTKWLDANALDR
jgi:hypothetical protein